MKLFLLTILISSGIFGNAHSQSIELTAIYNATTSSVKLNWNMVNASVKTSYILLRSADGIAWTEAARDKLLRNYTEDDVYFFNDRFYSTGKNFYRLRIFDGYNNTIALSVIVTVNTNIPEQTPSSNRQPPPTTKENNAQSKNNGNWIIYPNPATDLLKLFYKGSGELKGVVNVQIQDARGKIVIKFRSGSMYKLIQIPISHLQKGAYFIQVTVLNELMMNQKFIKQ